MFPAQIFASSRIFDGCGPFIADPLWFLQFFQIFFGNTIERLFLKENEGQSNTLSYCQVLALLKSGVKSFSRQPDFKNPARPGTKV
jgi:hypothetical protein